MIAHALKRQDKEEEAFKMAENKLFYVLRAFRMGAIHGHQNFLYFISLVTLRSVSPITKSPASHFSIHSHMASGRCLAAFPYLS